MNSLFPLAPATVPKSFEDSKFKAEEKQGWLHVYVAILVFLIVPLVIIASIVLSGANTIWLGVVLTIFGIGWLSWFSALAQRVEKNRLAALAVYAAERGLLATDPNLDHPTSLPPPWLPSNRHPNWSYTELVRGAIGPLEGTLVDWQTLGGPRSPTTFLGAVTYKLPSSGDYL